WVDTAEFAQGAESSHQAPRRVKTERLPSKWTQPWIVATVLVPLIAVTGIVLHNTGIDRAHAPGSQQSSAPLGQPQVKRDNQRPPHAPRNPTHRTDAAA
ncbi:MAG TPA: hypothetical protein VJQ54_10710, partial [Candidatus Sulfotelmatobacter sp.]|nr:hypothetical protein [Candidatus Sulfotelmatobacter sp.]